jgi:hypothetical protein
MAKHSYGDHTQTSGVSHYEVGADHVVVHFGGRSYKYSNHTAGKKHVDAMKDMATRGVGLARYIQKEKPAHDR